jgi:hypothetical protein
LSLNEVKAVDVRYVLLSTFPSAFKNSVGSPPDLINHAPVKAPVRVPPDFAKYVDEAFAVVKYVDVSIVPSL